MAMNTALSFSYKIARTVLMQSLVEASISLGSAVGSYSALSSANAEQNTLNKLQTKENPNLEKLKNRETDLNKTLNDSTISKADKTASKNELQDIKDKKDEINSRIDEQKKKADQQMQRASSMTNLYDMASKGMNAVPQGYSNSIQNIGNAVKSVMDQMQSMLSSSYDKLMQTLKGFLDINYLSGLVALGSIQLR
jgi:gas vesicle protein